MTTRLAFRKEETSWFPFGHATARSLPTMPLPSYAPAHPLPFPTSRPMKPNVGVSGSAMPEVHPEVGSMVPCKLGM